VYVDKDKLSKNDSQKIFPIKFFFVKSSAINLSKIYVVLIGGISFSPSPLFLSL